MIKVLLVCDFYEPKQIPNEVFSVKKNITLFPISNIPLIEYIMEHLFKNGFKDVILAGPSYLSILEYLKRTKYYRNMRIESFTNEYQSLGDIMRDIDERDTRINDLLIYYANTFVNFDLKEFYKQHINFKKEDKKVICTTVLLNESPEITNNLYGCDGKNIIYFEQKNRKGDFDIDVRDLNDKYPNLNFLSDKTKPRIFIVSSEIFSLFTEYFDCKTLEGIISSLLLLNAYNYKICQIDISELPLFVNKIKKKKTFDLNHVGLGALSFTQGISGNEVLGEVLSEEGEVSDESEVLDESLVLGEVSDESEVFSEEGEVSDESEVLSELSEKVLGEQRKQEGKHQQENNSYESLNTFSYESRISYEHTSNYTLESTYSLETEEYVETRQVFNDLSKKEYNNHSDDNLGFKTSQKKGIHTKGMDSSKQSKGMDSLKQSKGMDSSKQSKGMDSSKQSKGMDSSKQSKGMDSSKQSLKQPKEIDSKSPLIDLNETYGKTISSIQDYFDINQYFKYFRVNSKKSEDFINFSEREYRKFGSNYISTQMNTNLQIESSIFGNSEIGKNYYVKSSNILNGCKIQGNLQNCIIWEDVFVKKNLKECLVISNDENGIIYLDKCDEDDLSDSKSDESDQETFFNNLIDYLQSVYDKMDEKETDMDDVLRQVSLLRISWNASNLDLIEAFGMFLCKTYNPNDLDNIIIKTSCFFPIIHGLTDDPNSQDLLMTSLNDHLKEEDIERKKKFVIRYGFIFLEDGLISRAVIKKYRNLMKKKS